MIASVATSVGAWVAIVAGALSALVATASYRGKARADEAESDVRLAGLFAELVPIANGRGGGQLSDAAVAEVLNADAVRAELASARDSQQSPPVSMLL